MKNFRIERDYGNIFNINSPLSQPIILAIVKADAARNIHRRYLHRISYFTDEKDIMAQRQAAGWKYKGVRPMFRMPRFRYKRKDQSQ